MRKVKLPKADPNPTKYTPNNPVPKDLKADEPANVDIKTPTSAFLTGKPNPNLKRKK